MVLGLASGRFREANKVAGAAALSSKALILNPALSGHELTYANDRYLVANLASDTG